jgi:very-short-patch-repair endonuclease
LTSICVVKGNLGRSRRWRSASTGSSPRWQLLGLCVGRGAIAHSVRIGRLHVWYRGVYAVGHRAVRREGRWMAAVLAAGPDAVLSHRSAAALWAIRPTARTRIEVTVAVKRRSTADIQIHHARLASDEVMVRDGIPVTTPQRTLVDLAAVLSSRELAKAANQAEILRLPAPDRNRYRGRRGIRALPTTEPAPTRNDFEQTFVALLDAHDLPTPLVNSRIGPYVADFAWPRAKLVVELDGFATHGTRQAFERDRARDRTLSIAGWRVIRITWRQLHEKPKKLAGELQALLSRGRRPQTLR